jgi:hypothetical protein
MRALFTAWLIAWSLFACGCAVADEQFSLSAKLVRPQETNAPLRLLIELRNVSAQPQRVASLTNLFEGPVYLRDVQGDVHEFIQSNYWKMLVTGFWSTPTIELAPGGSYRWEHALAEFIDSHRLHTEHIGNSYPIPFPILSAEFQPGCEIWCAFDVRQKKMLDERRSTHETTATVISPTVRYPK